MIIQLGQTRGEIYRNGILSIEPELWDDMVKPSTGASNEVNFCYINPIPHLD